MTDSLAQANPEREPADDARFAETDVVLRDGRAVHLRSICASDEAELLQAFERLSPEARYMRFMRVVRSIDTARLRKTLAAFPQGGDTIIATIPAADGIDIVGGATFVILDDPSVCEFAISVAAEFGGAGLGSTLMTALIDTARRRGLKEMEGFVLSANQPMLRLASRMGFTVSRDPEDSSVRICRLRLAPP